jgi:hypothetical protein
MTETATLLDALHEFVCRFVRFADEHQAVAVVLWILHAWAFDAWSITPRLAVGSAEKGSGKTRLFEVMELLTPGAQRPANISPAALFRIIEAGTVTLLIDEADAIFSARATGPTEELRAILNAGYRKGATVLRVEGDRRKEVKAFPVFAPVAIAGIGCYLPDSVDDRCIKIGLRKRAPHESIERFRYAVAAPEGAELHRRAHGWAGRNSATLAETEPVYVESLPDRQADSWSPLLAIADLAGADWPERARTAAVALCGDPDDTDQLTIGVRLLSDCRHVMGAEDRITTSELMERLGRLDEGPWGDWYGRTFTARDLAKRLRPYGIRSRDVRYGPGATDKAKGYRREDFQDAWTRYLPPADPSRVGDIGDTSDTPSIATQDLSPLSPLSPALEGPVDNGHRGIDGLGALVSSEHDEAVRLLAARFETTVAERAPSQADKSAGVLTRLVRSWWPRPDRTPEVPRYQRGGTS